jgi:hypothetical protein
MFRPVFRTLFFLVLFAATYGHSSNWRFNAGLGARNLTPIVFVGGIGYKDAVLRVQGMGVHNGPSDYWCGVRGSLLWTFFRELPFNFDAGIGGGYEFAEAPNKLHKAFNKANDAMLVLPYNYKEIGDISIELWTHLYGFYTQISVPAYQFIEHDPPKLLWGAGYMVDF